MNAHVDFDSGLSNFDLPSFCHLQDMTSLFKKILDLTYPFTSMFSGEIYFVYNSRIQFVINSTVFGVN